MDRAMILIINTEKCKDPQSILMNCDNMPDGCRLQDMAEALVKEYQKTVDVPVKLLDYTYFGELTILQENNMKSTEESLSKAAVLQELEGIKDSPADDSIEERHTTYVWNKAIDQCIYVVRKLREV